MNYKFLEDENELDKFLYCIRSTYNLEKAEVLLLMLMSRNKYLNEEEKKTVSLSRANVVSRQIISSLDTKSVVKALHKMEAGIGAYLDNNGNPLPQQVLIPYIGYNPVSPIKAFADTQKCFVEYLVELNNANDKSNVYSRLQRIDRQYMTQLHHAFSRKPLIDIDFDLPRDVGFRATDSFMSKLKNHEARSFRIETRSGFHVLIDRSTLNYNWNIDLTEVREDVRIKLDGKVDKWEIEVNANEGVPLPGCLQKDHLVRIV